MDVSEQIVGGGGGIRTPDTREGMLVFKTSAFNHSATPPLSLISSYKKQKYSFIEILFILLNFFLHLISFSNSISSFPPIWHHCPAKRVLPINGGNLR